MKSYIVRIYRQDAGASNRLLGTVAGLEETDDQPFSSADELWDILVNRQALTDYSEHGEFMDSSAKSKDTDF